MAFLKGKAHGARNHECFLEKAFSERGAMALTRIEPGIIRAMGPLADSGEG
jgi:hypothetical protein